MVNLDNALTVADVAEIFGVHNESVRRWIRKGDLKAYSIGGNYKITKEAIEAFVESRAS